MIIKLNEFLITDLTMNDVSMLVEIFDSYEYDVIYEFDNQKADAKSLINLLAINICSQPNGVFIIDEKESSEKIEQLINFLKSKKN